MGFGTPHLEIRRPSPTTVEFTVTTQPRRTGWTGWALRAAAVVLRVVLAGVVAVALWGWARSQPWGGGGNVEEDEEERWREDGGGSGWMAATATATAAAAAVAAAAAATPGWLLLPLCAAGAWASVARVHRSESLLVLRGLGIQTRSTGATYVGELGSGLGLAWWTLTSPWALLRVLVAAVAAAPPVDAWGWGGGWGGGFGGLGGGARGLGGDDYEPSPAAATRFIPTARLQDLLVNEAFRGFEVRYYLVAVVVGTTGTSGWCADGSGGGGGVGGGDGFGYAPSGEHQNIVGSAGSNGSNSSSSRSTSGTNSTDRDYGAHGTTSSQLADGDDEDHVVVVFPQLLPGLDIVRTVWREARACLYEPDDETKR